MNKALIVIDVQKYFLTKKTKIIVEKISNYLKISPQKYSLIYFTIFRNDPDAPLWMISEWKDCTHSPNTDICNEIKEFTNNNNLFYKNILSAAKVPQIIQGIKSRNIREVHLCGFDTDCCVLATAYDLFDQGIKPVILEDLTWSTSKEKLHHPALRILERNIGFVEKIN
jgi:nicotinamidase-related amidase